MQRCRRSDDDKQRGEVRKRHPDQGVGADTAQLRPGAARGNAQRLDVAAMRLLHLLASLPEKQIGANGGAQYRHQRHRVLAVKGEMRNQRAVNCFAPWHARDKHHGDIGK